MKPSHYTTPRTLEACDFQPWGQAIHHSPRRDRIAGYVLALAIGVSAAVCLIFWSAQ